MLREINQWPHGAYKRTTNLANRLVSVTELTSVLRKCPVPAAPDPRFFEDYPKLDTTQVDYSKWLSL